MRTDVIMPQMGESVAEGTVTKWLKRVGDKVERDEPLFEISTDKVDAEIPSPASGFLAEILVTEGTTVAINTRVAVLTKEPGGAADAGKAPAGAGTSAEAPRAPAEAAPVPTPETAPAAGQAPDTLAGAEKGELDAATLRRLRSSPLVRRIAQEHNVDIGRVQGSGLSGRVTKKDILEHIESRPARGAQSGMSRPAQSAPAAQAQAAPPSQAAAQAPAQPAASTPAPAAQEGRAVKAAVSFDVPPHFLSSPGPHDQVQAMTPMRRKIAEHMTWSRRISAHVNSFLEVDMTRIVRLREKHKNEFLTRTGEKLTYMPFIMAATVSALKAFPDCNASVVGDDIVYHRDIHLGVAVALDWGLLVPVVKKADEKNVLGLTRSLNDIASRARNKKLSPDEVAGGTFTITNPGAFGSLTGTPIINQPQVAILGVGAINKRAWVMEGPEGDSIAVRHIMMMSLSYDHRLVDGATGAKFLNHIRDYLEGFDGPLY